MALSRYLVKGHFFIPSTQPPSYLPTLTNQKAPHISPLQSLNYDFQTFFAFLHRKPCGVNTFTPIKKAHF